MSARTAHPATETPSSRNESVPPDLRPFSLTLFGDWFFEDDRGRVHFFDTVGGKLLHLGRPCSLEFPRCSRSSLTPA